MPELSKSKGIILVPPIKSTLACQSDNTRKGEKSLPTALPTISRALIMTSERNGEPKEVDRENEPMMPKGKKSNEPKLNSPKVNLSLGQKKNS